MATDNVCQTPTVRGAGERRATFLVPGFTHHIFQHVADRSCFGWLHLVRKRGQLLAHIQNTRAQYQLPEFGRRLAYPANRTGVSEPFPDPIVRKSIAVDLALLERYDGLITDLELTIVREAKQHDGDAFHRLRSVPGIGKILALAILYEIHDIARFDRVQEFASYARLVKCAHISAGKVHGNRCWDPRGQPGGALPGSQIRASCRRTAQHGHVSGSWTFLWMNPIYREDSRSPTTTGHGRQPRLPR